MLGRRQAARLAGPWKSSRATFSRGKVVPTYSRPSTRITTSDTLMQGIERQGDLGCYPQVHRPLPGLVPALAIARRSLGLPGLLHGWEQGLQVPRAERLRQGWN